MDDRLTIVIERDGDWFVSHCREVPGANGQGKTADDCGENLRQAISLILEGRVESVCRQE
jgi:predicted RNase H-like HicB family nuclease